MDVETGGLDPTKHPITEVAIVAVDEKFKELNQWSTFVKPYGGLTIDKKALDSTNVTMSDINKGMDVKDVVKVLCQFMKDLNPSGRPQGRSIVTGHNVSFDISFLNLMFQHGKKEFSKYIASNNGEIDRICTMRLAALKWDGQLKSVDAQSYKLGVCCKRAGIKLVDAHGAMADVRATIKLLKHFQLSMQGEAQEATEVVEKTRLHYQF